MKKKYLFLMAVVVIMCVFAISVSAAEIPEWTDVTPVDIDFTQGFDQTSRVMLSNGDNTYSVYYTNYIIGGSDGVFSVSNELNFEKLNDATDHKYNYGYGSVVRLEIPVGFTEIEARALRSDRGFTSMLTVKVPEGVTKLGTYTAYNNAVLVEVELPKTLELIDGQENFISCKSLRKINIPSKITTIPTLCFSGCTSLTDVTGCEGVVTIKESGFKTCPLTNTDYNIFSGVEVIESIAFYGCGLSGINLPNATSVGFKAFAKSLNLETVLIGAASVGENAFAEKCPITSLTLLGTESIGANAFQYIKVENVIIPASCQSVGKSAFAYGSYNTVTLSASTTLGSNVFTGHKNSVTVNCVGGEMNISGTGLAASKTTVNNNVNYCVAYNGGVHDADEYTVNDNNFFSNIIVTGDCNACKESNITLDTIEPIFEWVGYSACTFGDGYSMTQGFKVNRASIGAYEKYATEFDFGVLATVNASGEAIAPQLEDEGVIASQFDGNKNDYLDIKVTGIPKDNADTVVVFCIYAIKGGSMYYLDNGKMGETVDGISYNRVLEVAFN